METIKCTVCEVEKNVSEFYKSKRHKLGYIPTCKECESLRHSKKYDPKRRKKHYTENRETYLLRSKIYNEQNKEKIKVKTQEYYKNNKMQFLEYSWKSNGVLNKNSEFFKKKDFDELFEKANKSCMICGVTNANHVKGFVVDHCHKTGFARGILCAHCNVALGSFRDDKNILQKAIDYLINHEPKRGEDGCKISQHRTVPHKRKLLQN